MKALRRIYFDESGYTGCNFLDPRQPVFTVASTDIEDSEANAILNTSFPDFQGKEFKFTRVFRRPRHRRCLLAFSEQLSRIANRVLIYNCDKKFTALVKAVDVLVEPIFHDNGRDFYAEGYNRQYVNMFHFGLCQFAKPEVYSAVIRCYERFSHNPNDEKAIHRLCQIAESCPDEVRSFMDMLVVGAIHCFGSRRSLDPMNNDIQLTCVLALVNHWRARNDNTIEIIHDASSNFFGQIEHWNRITSTEVEPAIVTAEDGRHVVFPLNVSSTRPGDSIHSSSLQLCDMIAGLSAYLFGPADEVKSVLRREILEAGFGGLTCDGIRPGNEFINDSPQAIIGCDVVDQFIMATRKRREFGDI